mgnify:CR=1 FL=1
MKMADESSVSKTDLMSKIADVPKQAGCAVIKSALVLYVLLKEAEVPIWAKASIVAALVYFISPIDAYPDFLPGGYIDDLATMGLLLTQLEMFVSMRVRDEAEELLPAYCRERKNDILI